MPPPTPSTAPARSVAGGCPGLGGLPNPNKTNEKPTFSHLAAHEALLADLGALLAALGALLADLGALSAALGELMWPSWLR